MKILLLVKTLTLSRKEQIQRIQTFRVCIWNIYFLLQCHDRKPNYWTRKSKAALVQRWSMSVDENLLIINLPDAVLWMLVIVYGSSNYPDMFRVLRKLVRGRRNRRSGEEDHIPKSPTTEKVETVSIIV